MMTNIKKGKVSNLMQSKKGMIIARAINNSLDSSLVEQKIRKESDIQNIKRALDEIEAKNTRINTMRRLFRF